MIPGWVGSVLILAGGLALLLILTMTVLVGLDHWRIIGRHASFSEFDIAGMMMGATVHVEGRVQATFTNGKVTRERAIELINQGWDRLAMDLKDSEEYLSSEK